MGWAEFVKNYSIEHVAGSGGKDRNINIVCPFCDIRDFTTHSKKHHMGLSTQTSDARWACWRNAKHRSRGSSNPERLIQKLLKCPIEQAEDLALAYFGSKPLEFRRPNNKTEIKPVDKPPDFFNFGTDEFLEKRFLKYLNKRVDAEFAINRFDIKWCIAGDNADRVVIPIIYNNEWYSWVARAISDSKQPRYLAADKSICSAKPADLLFDIDNLTGGKTLIVSEGVFDAIAVSACLIPQVSATCLFGKVLTMQQLKLLMVLSKFYERVVIALDKDAILDSLALIDSLDFYLPNYSILNLKSKDFGSMSRDEIHKEIEQYV